MDDLKKIVSLLIKSFRLRLSKNKTISNTEKEELKILETISDISVKIHSIILCE